MNALAAVRRAVEALMPWPPRHQRKAAIRRARAEKERSRRSAAEAEAVREDIQALAARNHFAASLTAQIVQRHGRRGAS